MVFLLLLFLFSLSSYFIGVNLDFWFLLVLLYSSFRFFLILKSFKTKLPLFDVFSFIYLIDNVISIAILKYFFSDYFITGESLYVVTEVEEYLPFAFISMQSVYLGYRIMPITNDGWNRFLTNKFTFDAVILRRLYYFAGFYSLLIANSLDFFAHFFDMLLSSIGIAFFFIDRKKYFKEIVFAIFLLIYRVMITGMFGALLVVLIFLILFAIRRKILISNFKFFYFKLLLGAVIGGFFIVVLQNYKIERRTETWGTGSFSLDLESKGITGSGVYYLPTILRLNQAYQVSAVMQKVPSQVEFQKGNTILNSAVDAFVPRFVNLNKEKAGGRNKIEKFTNLTMVGSTSMNIGYLGESYLNFGKIGSFGFFFLFGIFYSQVEMFFTQRALTDNIILIFTPLFLESFVGSGIDFMLLFNNLVKTFVLVAIILGVLRFFKLKN